MKIDQLSELLGIEKKVVMDRIIDWADMFNFKINKDEILFEGGNKEKFIEELKKEISQIELSK